MAFMETSARTIAAKPAPGNAPAAVGTAAREFMARVSALIAAELPGELKHGAEQLLRAVVEKVAVAEHFDAFCGQAFSKPDWAAAASPVIAEMFDHDEDLLAELARIPDLIIEMGSGQVTMTCMVASRWAARGETHRLSRLADSIVASHASKNACAVEVMLALAATLAVTRFSRAEQLYHAALPLSGEEQREALEDARKWLAAGRIVCSASQEERDFWDVRLRKPRVEWTWKSGEERQALDTLAERLTPGMDGTECFQAVVPVCWWDLAMKSAEQQESLAKELQRAREVRPEPMVAPSRVMSDAAVAHEPPSRMDFASPPKAGPYARFVLGWACGAMAMAITVVLLPSEVAQRILTTLQARSSDTGTVSTRQNIAGPVLHPPKTAKEREDWRKVSTQRMAAEMTEFATQHAAAKAGTWSDNERMLSGQSAELPLESPNYMKFLVWLHLDPPQDPEVRSRVAKLFLDRVKAGAISLWEELVYPESLNASEIRSTAREALNDTSVPWTNEDKERLRAIVAGEVAASTSK